MTLTTHSSVSAPAAAPACFGAYPDYSDEDSGGLLQKAKAVMLKLAQLNTDQANALIKTMSDAADKVRNDQILANQVAAIIAGMKGPDDKATLSDDLINSMRNSKISFTWQGNDGKTHTGNIDDYLNSVRAPVQYPSPPPGYIGGVTLEQVDYAARNATIPEYIRLQSSYRYDQAMAEAVKKANEPVPLNKGQLDLIKSALDTAVQHGTDMQSSQQLALQADLQRYNVLTTDINSLQSMFAEALKAIAANIR